MSHVYIRTWTLASQGDGRGGGGFSFLILDSSRYVVRRPQVADEELYIFHQSVPMATDSQASFDYGPRMALIANSIVYLHLFMMVALANGVLNVVNFGAVGSGKVDASSAFQAAWAQACGSSSPTTIHVPRGKYFIRSVVFSGPCLNPSIVLRLDGSLVADAHYNDDSSQFWIMFDGVRSVSLIGGRLDGRGSTLWACKQANQNCPDGPTSLAFYNSTNILVHGLTSINSKLFHIAVLSSESVTLRNVNIRAPRMSPNTDGIHVQQSTDVQFLNAGIKTGDDCISVGPGVRNLWVQRVSCGPGHGISIGSLAKSLDEDGVQNVTVKNVVFKATQNGYRIKTWARHSQSFVRGVLFDSAKMINVQNPIIIDQHYCPNDENCPRKESDVQIRDVIFKNIKGTSATKIAVNIDCSASAPCHGIMLHDIQLVYNIDKHNTALSSCKNVNGIATHLVSPQGCL